MSGWDSIINENVQGENVEVEGILHNVQEIPEVSDILADPFIETEEAVANRNVFEESRRKAWNTKKILARCDMSYILKISPRCGVSFISIWKKTLYGRLLTEIKEDDSMISYFAIHMAQTIKSVVGEHLSSGGWCLVTAPKRRHLKRNFATLVSIQMAELLDIHFYEDIIECKNKQRMNAVFSLKVVPTEPNIIVFDDIVTTGSTLASIKAAFDGKSKNLMFFTGINNKL